MLITPAVFEPAAFVPVLAEALAAADIAAVMLDLADPRGAVWRRAARMLRPVVQERAAAFLIRDRTDLACEVGADGAHVTGGVAALEAAMKRLKPDMIVGAGDCTTRHAAMMLGERGPDYIFLGRLDPEADIPAAASLVDWWSELFELPSIALGAEDWDRVEAAVAAGADFVALRDLVWNEKAGAAEAVRHGRAICHRRREEAA